MRLSFSHPYTGDNNVVYCIARVSLDCSVCSLFSSVETQHVPAKMAQSNVIVSLNM